jgi:hypothetical protein
MNEYHGMIIKSISESDGNFEITNDHVRHIKTLMRIEYDSLDYLSKDEIKPLILECHRSAILLGSAECDELAEVIGTS